jgi:hypothetical protein
MHTDCGTTRPATAHGGRVKHREHDIDQGDTAEWFLGLTSSADGTNPIETVTPFTEAPAPATPREPRLPVAADRRGGRRFTVLWVLLAITVAVWLLVWLLPQIPQRQADRVAVRYRVALDSLANAVPGAGVAAQAVTDPAIPTDRLGEVVPAITVLGQAAGTITDLAAEALPSPPPLIPAGPIDDLVSVRGRLATLGPEADAVSKGINAVLGYRTLAEGILDIGGLPVDADPAEENRLSVSLASSLADSAGALGALPEVTALAAHRSRLAGAVERFEAWQVEYLDALRRDDTAAATTLVEEFTALRDVLDSSLEEALADAAAALDAELTAVETSIGAIRSMLDA